jgi:hypothetical protein
MQSGSGHEKQECGGLHLKFCSVILDYLRRDFPDFTWIKAVNDFTLSLISRVVFICRPHINDAADRDIYANTITPHFERLPFLFTRFARSVASSFFLQALHVL